MATYEEAISAVENGVGGQAQYAADNNWPMTQYIGLNGTQIYKYDMGSPKPPVLYQATDQEKLDTWTYDGDKPPR